MTDDTRLLPEPLITPGEVAAALRVDPRTVSRWAKAGKLRSSRTPGGRWRFNAADVRALLEPVQQ